MVKRRIGSRAVTATETAPDAEKLAMSTTWGTRVYSSDRNQSGSCRRSMVDW
jgi:hypothetical protein